MTDGFFGFCFFFFKVQTYLSLLGTTYLFFGFFPGMLLCCYAAFKINLKLKSNYLFKISDIHSNIGITQIKQLEM